MAEYKVDLFEILKSLDLQRLDVYEKIKGNDELKKEFDKIVGWLLVQWMTGAVSEQDHRQAIVNFNDIGNIGWDRFKDHPELQTKLLALCGLGTPVKHKFYKPKKAVTGSALEDLLAQLYPDIRKDEVDLWVRRNTLEGLADLAEICGCQESQVKKLVEEFAALKR